MNTPASATVHDQNAWNLFWYSSIHHKILSVTLLCLFATYVKLCLSQFCWFSFPVLKDLQQTKNGIIINYGLINGAHYCVLNYWKTCLKRQNNEINSLSVYSKLHVVLSLSTGWQQWRDMRSTRVRLKLKWSRIHTLKRASVAVIIIFHISLIMMGSMSIAKLC